MKPVLLHTGPFQVNTWIVPLTDRWALVVDPAACSFSRDEAAIVSYLRENRLEPAGIFLTHGHFDHITKKTPNCAEGALLQYRAPFSRRWDCLIFLPR